MRCNSSHNVFNFVVVKICVGIPVVVVLPKLGIAMEQNFLVEFYSIVNNALFDMCSGSSLGEQSGKNFKAFHIYAKSQSEDEKENEEVSKKLGHATLTPRNCPEAGPARTD